MHDSTTNPAPPLVAGLTWRTITSDDLASVGALAAACQLADGGLVFMNEPDTLKERYFPGAPGTGIGAFDADGQLIACITVHLVGEPGAEYAGIVGQVRPEFRHQGLGTYLMQWSQAQAEGLFMATTADKRLLQIRTESLTDPARRLYEAHGFQCVFEELVMRRDLNLPLPDCPLPGDMTLTEWDPARGHQFFQAYQAAFRARPGFPGWSAEQWIAQNMENDKLQPAWSLLARTAEESVGFILASSEQPDSYIIQVGVIPEQRRKGVASALMVETMRRMRAAGQTGVLLTVHLNNPGAIAAYVELGFETVGRRAQFERILGGDYKIA